MSKDFGLHCVDWHDLSLRVISGILYRIKDYKVGSCGLKTLLPLLVGRGSKASSVGEF